MRCFYIGNRGVSVVVVSPWDGFRIKALVGGPEKVTTRLYVV